MATSNPFFFLNKVHGVFRMFLVVSAFSLYGSLLYEFIPSLSITQLLYYLVLPAVSTIVTINVMPTLGVNKQDIGNKVSKSSESPKKNLEKSDQKLDSQEAKSQIVNQSASQNSVLETTNTSNEMTINPQSFEKLINNSLEPVKSDLSELKVKVNGFDEEIGNLKTDLESLKTKGEEKNETYETTLRDLKAFQAEIDNPFNFISKYFEMLNVSNLYDGEENNSRYHTQKISVKKESSDTDNSKNTNVDVSKKQNTSKNSNQDDKSVKDYDKKKRDNTNSPS